MDGIRLQPPADPPAPSRSRIWRLPLSIEFPRSAGSARRDWRLAALDRSLSRLRISSGAQLDRLLGDLERVAEKHG